MVNIHIATSIPKSSNRRQAGEYIYVLEAETEKGIYTKDSAGFEPDTTKNRLTLIALNEALGRLKAGEDARIYTENTYVRHPIEEGWIYRWKADGFQRSQVKAGKKYFIRLENADLWEKLFHTLQEYQITWADEPGSYHSWMKEELKRRRKEIQIEYYKGYTHAGGINEKTSE